MVSGLSGIKDLINHLENREEKKKIFIILKGENKKWKEQPKI